MTEKADNVVWKGAHANGIWHANSMWSSTGFVSAGKHLSPNRAYHDLTESATDRRSSAVGVLLRCGELEAPCRDPYDKKRTKLPQKIFYVKSAFFEALVLSRGIHSEA